MSTATYADQAELALAAYGTFVGTAIDPLVLRVPSVGMPETEAKTFSESWTLVDSTFLGWSGASATVFKKDGITYLAVRGTELGPRDLGADGLLAAGVPAILNPQFIGLKEQVQAWINSGVLPSTFTVTGHSLGGYLAVAIKEAFSANVSEAYVFNAPGTWGAGATFSDFMLNSFGFSEPVGANGVFNIQGSEGFSVIANMGFAPSAPIPVLIEGAGGVGLGNHSMNLLVDALKVQDLLHKIDSSLTLEGLNTLLRAAAAVEANTFENVVSTLHKLILSVPVSIALDDKEALYVAMQSIEATLLANPTFGIVDLSGFTTEALLASAALASNVDNAILYAISTETSFAVVGADYDGKLPAWSEQQLQDRVLYFKGLMQENIADNSAASVAVASTSQSVYIRDFTTGHDAIINGDSYGNTQDQVLFGASADGFMATAEGNDRVYGFSGNDTIASGDGSDYIEGGIGNDTITGGTGANTYYYIKGDGSDSISLEGGFDQLKFDTSVASTDIMLKKVGTSLEVHLADGSVSTISNWTANSANFSIVLPDGTPLFPQGIQEQFIKQIETPSNPSFVLSSANASLDADSIRDSVMNIDSRVAYIEGTFKTNPGYASDFTTPQSYGVLTGANIGNQNFSEYLQNVRAALSAPSSLAGQQLISSAQATETFGNTQLYLLRYENGATPIAGSTTASPYSAEYREATQWWAADMVVWVDANDNLNIKMLGVESGSNSDGRGTSMNFDYYGIPFDVLDITMAVKGTPTESMVAQIVSGAMPLSSFIESAPATVSTIEALVYSGAGPTPEPFADPVVISYDSLTAHFNSDSQGTCNNWIFGESTGSEIIDLTYSSATNNSIITGFNSTTVTYEKAGNDLILTAIESPTSDNLRLVDFFNQTSGKVYTTITFGDNVTKSLSSLYAPATSLTESADSIILPDSYNSATVYGLAGNDTIQTFDQDNTMVGGLGDDTLKGGNGNDTYVFNLGEGHDTVYEKDSTELVATSYTDTIQLGEGILKETTTVSRSGLDLTLTFNVDDSITLKDWYTAAGSAKNKVETVQFNNGDSFSAAELDTLGLTSYGTTGADVIALTANSVSNYVQIYDAGAGDDAVTGSVNSDVLKGGAGNDILGGVAGTSDIGYIQGYSVVRPNGGNTYEGGAGNDTLRGTCISDTYVFNLGDGFDTIFELNLNVANTDMITFGQGIIAADVQAYKVGNDLALKHTNGVDGVTIKDWFTTGSATKAIEQFSFSDGTTITSANILQGIVYQQGSANADVLSGVQGISNIIHGADGNDTLGGSDGSDKVYGDAGNDNIHGGYGQDWLYGGTGNDVLGSNYQDIGTNSGGTSFVSPGSGNIYEGGTGTDILIGSALADTYVFHKGDGLDTLNEVSPNISGLPASLTDTIVFDHTVAPADLTLSRSGSHLLINYGTGDTITVSNFYHTTVRCKIEAVQFLDANGQVIETWSESLIEQKGMTVGGTANADTLWGYGSFESHIYGMAGNDNITGGVGVDHLYGGDGNDILTGSNGNDELFGDAGTDNLSGGDGNDTLDGGLGNDTLNGGTGNNWLKGWVDADTLTASGKSVLQGGDGVDNVSATAYSLLAGGAGNDILAGFGVIAGQAGNDTITVSGNNSTVLFNFGTDGADILSIGAGVSGTQVSLSGVDVADLTLKRVGTSDNLFIGIDGSTDGLQINGVLSEGTLALGAQIWREINGERSGDSFDFSGVISDFIASPSYLNGATLGATQLFIDNTTTPEHLNSSSAIAGGLLAAGYVADNGSFSGVSIGDSFDYLNAGVQLMGVATPTHFDGWLL